MADSLVVLKCRECGASRATGYTEAEHSRLDGCDGCLAFYCNACRSFITTAECASCESHVRKAEKRRLHERRARIEKLLSTPGISLAYSLLRRWPWFEAASDDFVALGGVARGKKNELAMAAGAAALGMCAPPWMQIVLWMLIAVLVFVLLCSRTLPDHRSPHA